MTATTWHRVPPPLGDDEPNNASWEPWTPQVGDRVRVRLSGECPYCFEGGEFDSGEEIQDGDAVTVSRIRTELEMWEEGCSDAGLMHRYWVLNDLGQMSHFAAAELELLSDSEPAADERRRAR